MMKKQRTLLLNHSILLILITLGVFWLGRFASAVAAPVWQEGHDLAIINVPASNAVVRGPVQIVGSSDHPSFQFYAIEFSPEPVTGDQWQIIGATHNVVEEIVPGIPTDTPTPLPPTPTVIVEQPIVETPTPRPVETTAPLEDPDEVTSFIPTVTGFSFSPLRDACIYGAGIMLSVFLLFGFLAALRMFIMGFIHRLRRKT
ncbi:MAG: hypothetical protein HYR94_21490 [Chloroflexi bacterium]|nr:hypothetical protein [Chloroflexota bacterium]